MFCVVYLEAFVYQSTKFVPISRTNKQKMKNMQTQKYFDLKLTLELFKNLQCVYLIEIILRCLGCLVPNDQSFV